jgi:Helix-turn-helix domain
MKMASIPVDLLSDNRLGPKPKLVAMTLASLIPEGADSVTTSYEEITLRCLLDGNSVQSAVSELEKTGWLVKGARVTTLSQFIGEGSENREPRRLRQRTITLLWLRGVNPLIDGCLA